MNQEKIGKFIAEKRKEKNMTQAELASKLNVTDRAVSHWVHFNLMFLFLNPYVKYLIYH